MGAVVRMVVAARTVGTANWAVHLPHFAPLAQRGDAFSGNSLFCNHVHGSGSFTRDSSARGENAGTSE